MNNTRGHASRWQFALVFSGIFVYAIGAQCGAGFLCALIFAFVAAALLEAGLLEAGCGLCFIGRTAASHRPVGRPQHPDLRTLTFRPLQAGKAWMWTSVIPVGSPDVPIALATP